MLCSKGGCAAAAPDNRDPNAITVVIIIVIIGDFGRSTRAAPMFLIAGRRL